MKQTINLGGAPGDHTGDSLRSGGDKINDNFTEVYDAAAAAQSTADTAVTNAGTALTAANEADDTADAAQTTANTALANAATNAADIASKANLASPTFTGTPTAPTASAGNNSTQLATTAYVDAAVLLLPNNEQTASYTAVLADNARAVPMTVATANTFTVPPNSSVPFPLGSLLTVEQWGAGVTTLTPGAGVTIRSRGGRLALNGQYAVATLRKKATDEWLAVGDLV